MAKTKQTKKKQTKAPPVLEGPGGVAIVDLAPAYEFSQLQQIWYGSPKSGKTSTFAALKQVAEEHGLEDEVKPFLLLFESGSGGVTCNATSEPCECKGKDKDCVTCGGVGSKRKVLMTLEDIDEWFEWAASSPYTIFGIDTMDAMFQVIMDQVCLKMSITNPSQSDFGAAWTEIGDMVREKLGILIGAGKSVVMIMHVYMQDKRLSGGITMQTATFNVSGKTRQYLEGLADIIEYFDITPDGDGDKYTILTRPTAGIVAGDRYNIFPDEGIIDRGDSAEEGAKAILDCFYDLEG